MTSTVMDAVSLIAIDLGTSNTRAHLFDVADGQYRFIATGTAASTVAFPYFDIGESIYQALNRLQSITGRILLDKDENLILPSQAGGEGVDRLVVTYSCGKPLKMVTFGLLGEASLESVNRLAWSIPGNVVESFGINDRRSIDARADALLNARPDLILFAGGIEHGATRSVLKAVDLICRVLQVMPAQERPEVIYTGNQDLASTVRDRIERFTAVHIAPNVRPQIDREEVAKVSQNIQPVINDIQSRYVNGLDRVATICNSIPEASLSGMEKMVRFLSSINDPQKGVLAFDIGSGTSTAVSGLAGATYANSFPFGTGTGLQEFLRKADLNKIHQWLGTPVAMEDFRDALYQKTLSPGSIPATSEALQIELAVARQMLREMVRQLRLRDVLAAREYDPILVSGSTLTRAASAQQILLTLLDGIQPFGITTLILDKHSILQSLGAAGLVKPFLPVQVLESSAFTNLATVVSPVSESRLETEIIKARLEYESGKFAEAVVKHGEITSMPLKPGETGKLYIQTLHRTRIEASGLVEDFYKVNGGILGVVIDARGRPLDMPLDERERVDLYSRWISSLGG